MLKFADETKLFSKANPDKDRGIMQLDLSRLVDWSEKCLMPFNRPTAVCNVCGF